MISSTPTRRLHVVIAGGGVAAVETALALRALTGRGLELTMIAPNEQLEYWPLSIADPAARPALRRYELAPICEDLDVALHRDRLVGVEADGDARIARTAAGGEIPCDALVLATGARPQPALPHAETVRPQQDALGLRRIERDILEAGARSVAFVVPPGPSWPLPLYELALMTAKRLRAASAAEVALTIVTPEDAPLGIFHGAGSAAVAGLLADAGIDVVTSSYAHDYDGGALVLTPGDRRLEADRVIALPRLAGPAIDGLPSDAEGFVHVDDHGRVPGLAGVYAVGDATTFPLKQGGIATQQADLVAALIAREAGVMVPEPDARPLLRAILLTGDQPLYLKATITGGESVISTASRHCPWWPPHKIAARHLAPYLADRDEADRPTALRHALAPVSGEPAVVHGGKDDHGIQLLGRDEG